MSIIFILYNLHPTQVQPKVISSLFFHRLIDTRDQRATNFSRNFDIPASPAAIINFPFLLSNSITPIPRHPIRNYQRPLYSL